MTSSWKPNRRTPGVLVAAGVSLALVLSLAGRVAARGAGDQSDRSRPPVLVDPGPAPSGSVPAPRPLTVSELPTPFCWTCPGHEYQPMEFQIDLDTLAPLGDGPGNAALWLAQFAKDVGPRAAESTGRIERLELDGKVWRVFPADDPLLLEAEGWMDQARCSFYPDVWEFTGMETRVPNLLFALNLARSWAARGRMAEDSESAREDYRRAIRLGRLLRQDDLTLIQDLVGLAAIRLGAEGLYDEARNEGDAVMMTAAALVMADKDIMRHFAARRARLSAEILNSVRKGWFGGVSLEATGAQVEDLIMQARRVRERRYKGEALVTLQLVRHLGTDEQISNVMAFLDELALSDDELTAAMATWTRDAPLERAQMEGLLDSGH